MFLGIVGNFSSHGQSSYVGVSGSFLQLNSKQPSGFMQNTNQKRTSLLLIGEYGIIRGGNKMFGVSLGVNYTRFRNQNSVSNNAYAVMGFNFRHFFLDADLMLRPFMETGAIITFGQTGVNQDYFNGRIPLKFGLMCPLRGNWKLLGSLELASFNHNRTGSLTESSFLITNTSHVSLSAIRYLR